jgi:hypothetical protein
LKNHGTGELVEEMFAMGEETMRLPLDEKMKFEQGDDGLSCGYVLALPTVSMLLMMLYFQIQSSRCMCN